MKTRELIRILEQNGYTMRRSSKHMIYSNGPITVAVPHSKELKSWTVNQIRKYTGLKFK